MPQEKVTVWAFRCERCGHRWLPREALATGKDAAKPGNCPKCKSPYWDKPRRDTSTKARSK